jgi:GTP 3',8-cyclase
MASQLTDAFARKFYYLRLSITDVCNFRCTYCLPDGYKPSGVTNKGFLTVDEIRRVTRAFASLGTEKVRLTGGEPSLRRDAVARHAEPDQRCDAYGRARCPRPFPSVR